MSYIENIFSLKGKVAAVIGGGGVLAGAMAEGLAKAGADIAILDLNPENAKNTADKMSAHGVKSLPIAVNATSKEELTKAEEQIRKELGATSILINAPGINSSTPFFEIAEEEWDKIIQVNLKSIFMASQIFV